MSDSLTKVDHGALKGNQIVIILLNLVAFILNSPWLVLFVAAVMLAGTFVAMPGFFLAYKYALKPFGLVKPNVLLDNPEPHRFAQGFGGVVLVLGFLALLAGFSITGWVLVWLVIALAALNAFGGFCAGCFLYYWLNQIGVPGFSKQPPEGIFPGLRPRG